MATGTVTATSLNLRARPGGTILGALRNGTTVRVLADHGDWLEVIAAGTRGFVSEGYVSLKTAPAEPPPTPSAGLPPEATEADLRVQGKRMVGPGGVVFGRPYRLGMYNAGRVTVADFLTNRPEHFAGAPQSLLRVLNAVSVNEGALEAINTWDNCFLSFGSLQWTAGSGSSPGELGGLLARLRAFHPDVYDAHFGRFGLSTAAFSTQPFALHYCHLSLDGRTLDTPAAKETLRRPIWAYRFWRAGHDETVCRCEIEHAIARLAVFYERPLSALGGRTVADLVSSEYGVALLFDQHTNRPGHVPGTLLQAQQGGMAAGELPPDSRRWSTAHESALLERYLGLRHTTSMTDSLGRAQRLAHAVASDKLSNARGSFGAGPMPS